MPRVLAEQILTTDFWTEFKAQAVGLDLTKTLVVLNFMDISKFEIYSKFKFGDVPFFPEVTDMTVDDRVSVALMDMGHAFERIADALLADYDPLENYFTEREVTTTTDGTVTKSGKETTTPSGTVANTTTGKTIRESDSGYTVGQGTTFDNASTNPDSTTDFRNISKTVDNTKVSEYSDANDPKKVETSFSNYKVEKEFSDVQNETDMTEGITESKRGSSGIFSKQDLTNREVDLRLRRRLLKIMVRMVVDVFSTGVYSE